MKADNWKDFIHQLIIDYCSERGSLTFTLQDFQAAKSEEIISFRETNNNPFAKLRQQLQFLREDGILSFVNNNGTYTLSDPLLSPNEFREIIVPFVHKKEPHKREYVKESFARDRGWVKEAKEKFGPYCLHPNCKNTFNKNDGLPYIEVHHIIPLFEGGDDAVWNLAVVCAHHHKMAHFADIDSQLELRKLFLKIVERLA